jgi:hypothetical protein
MKPTVIQDDGSDTTPSKTPLLEQDGTPVPRQSDAANQTNRRNHDRGVQATLAVARAIEYYARITFECYDSTALAGIALVVENSRDHLSALLDAIRARQALLTQRGL